VTLAAVSVVGTQRTNTALFAEVLVTETAVVFWVMVTTEDVEPFSVKYCAIAFTGGGES
jgi:hypothetical protein